MKILVITKRQYMKKDLITDQYGRFWEIPLSLANSGHATTGVCLSYSKTNSESISVETNCENVIWHSVNAGRLYLFGFIKFLILIKELIEKEEPDVIWSCSDTFYGVIGYWFSRRYKCKSVFDLYDNFESYASYKLPILRTLFRNVVKNSEGLSCVSTNLKDHVVSDYGRKKDVVLLTNAISTGKFYPMDKNQCRKMLGLPRDVALIGTAGALVERRGAHMIFDAIEKLREELGDIRIAVAGSRDPSTNIPRSEYIYDLGELPHERVPLLLNALDVAVVFNRDSLFGNYCFPQKFFEIVACETPLVAANIGEVANLLEQTPELRYENENIESFVCAIQYQLKNQRVLEFDIPDWNDQATILSKCFAS